VENALLSVLKQSYPPYEVIIVDDASEDLNILKEKIEKIGDERVKLITHEKNRNGAAARNTGINSSTGDYICFLDSDDEWECNHLDEISNLLKGVGEKKVLVYSSIKIFVDGKLNRLGPIRKIESEEHVFDYLMDHGLMQTSGLVIPNIGNESLHFNEKYTRHQDIDLVLSAAQRGYEFFWNECATVKWNICSDNTGLQKGESVEYCTEWIKENRYRISEKGYYAYRLLVIMRYAILQNKYKQVLIILVQSIGKVELKLLKRAIITSVRAKTKRLYTRYVRSY
jgi:amylovoran biosynthesis glycosyltransferase AmsB